MVNNLRGKYNSNTLNKINLSPVIKTNENNTPLLVQNDNINKVTVKSIKKKSHRDSHSKTHNASHEITIQISPLLHSRINAFLISRKNGGIFDFDSFSTFIKSALIVYKETGFSLAYNLIKNDAKKKKFNVRMDNKVFRIYDEIPKKVKGESIERILSIYLDSFKSPTHITSQ